MFSRLFRRPAASRVAPRRTRKPVLEGLEGRQLMSLSAEFAVSVPTPAAQLQSANASSANGSSVVVWTESTRAPARSWASSSTPRVARSDQR